MTTLSDLPLRKSVLCILSDASVRKYVPARHERKGGNIEQVIFRSTDELNFISNSLLGQSGKNIAQTAPGLESPRDKLKFTDQFPARAIR